MHIEYCFGAVSLVLMVGGEGCAYVCIVWVDLQAEIVKGECLLELSFILGKAS